MSGPAPSSAVVPPIALRVLLTLAWPVVLSRSTQTVIGFSDALMSAPLGEQALAATTAGSLNTFAVVILPMGVVYIVQSFAAQLSGRGDFLGARRYGWYGLLLAAATGVLSLAALPLIAPLLGLLDYEPAVAGMMGDYLVYRMFSVGAVVGVEALGNWYGGLGNTRLQMIASVVAMAVDVFLNWVLIFGHLGAPAMGVAGAALGSSIASWVGFAIMFVAFLRGWGVPRSAVTPVGSTLRLRGSEMWRMLRFGVPNGLNWFLEFSAFLVFINVAVAELGTVVVAALLVVASINSVSFMPSFGIGSAGAILAGQAIGAGRPDDVPRVVRLTLASAITWQLAAGLLYFLFPVALMSWFAPAGHKADELLAVGATMLAISAAWQLFDAIAITLGEILRAAGDTAWCLYARIVIAWVIFTPVSLVVVFVLDGGPVGAILCMAGYMAVLAAAFVWRFRSGRWREIDLTGIDSLPV